MKGFIAALVVIGVFCIIQVSANKMCYSCTNCATVDDDTATCNGTAYCSKVTIADVVTRGCDMACTEDKCTTAGNTETCCCNSMDKCNGAGALSSALVMVIAPLVASIFFTRS